MALLLLLLLHGAYAYSADTSACSAASTGPALACASCGASRFPVPGACILDGTRVDPGSCCADEAAVTLMQRLLDVLQRETFEATAAAVERGDSSFAAAILRNDAPGYPVLLAAANAVRTSHNPTAHGEMEAIRAFYQQQQQQQLTWPAPSDTIFLSTHQPCSLCLSGLAFSGFRRIFYGFDFAQGVNDGEAAGSILDVAVLEQVFNTRCGLVNHTNGMFTLVPLRAMLAMQPCGGTAGGSEASSKQHQQQQQQLLQEALQAARQQYEAIVDAYAELGERFQARMAARASNGGGGGGDVQLMAAACQGCEPFPRKECGAEFM